MLVGIDNSPIRVKMNYGKAVLRVDRLQVEEGLDKALATYWKNNPEKYLLSHSKFDLHTAALAAGIDSTNVGNTTIRRIPSILVVSLTSLANVQSGTFSKDSAIYG